MIPIHVSDQRQFTLPAGLAAVTEHFRDFERTIRHLQHLSLVRTYAPDRYRILYQAGGAGVYQVEFFCDIEVRYDDAGRRLHVLPLAGIEPVAPVATLTAMTGQGFYTSQSVFTAAGSATRLDYQVEIRADVPVPPGLRLVPRAVLQRVIENLTTQRLKAITDEYIRRTAAGLRSAGAASRLK